MASSSGGNFEVRVLLAKGKRAAADYIHDNVTNPCSPNHLQQVLDNLLNPTKTIEDWDTIDWCKWLMAGGKTPDEFSSIGKWQIFVLVYITVLTSCDSSSKYIIFFTWQIH